MTEWTKADDKKLQEICSEGKSASECARFFNESEFYRAGYTTSRNACIGRANRLGFTFGKLAGVRKQPPLNGWTKSEDSKLKKMCLDGKSPLEASEKLHRSPAACRIRAASLGVRFSDHVEFDVTASHDNKIYPDHEVRAGDNPVSIQDLNVRSCRWPLEVDGHHVGYCGAQKEGSYYCRFHAEMAYPILAGLTQGKKQKVA